MIGKYGQPGLSAIDPSILGQAPVYLIDSVAQTLRKTEKLGSVPVCTRPNKFGTTNNVVVGRNLLVPGALTGIPPDKLAAELSHHQKLPVFCYRRQTLVNPHFPVFIH
jgi:hypothetical protein